MPRRQDLSICRLVRGAVVRLMLVISSLAGGGAERIMSLLANGWVQRGIEVSLVTFGSPSSDVYDLNPAITRIGLNLLGHSENPVSAVLNNLRRIRGLRVAVRELRPDVLVSFMTSTNALSVIAANPFKLPVVVSERVWPEALPVGRAWEHLRRYAYRRAAVVVAQTRRTAEWLRERVPGATVEVIANPVNVEPSQSPDAAAQTVLAACAGRNLVLAAGRLMEQKGFDLLLRAFAPLARRRDDWRLAIFGEGPDWSALNQLATTLGISDRVIFPGFSRTLHAVMRRAQLFVLSSRYEGMPNVLVEAMASGAPCISFDCPTGPAELILPERNGLLVPAEDVMGLTSAMDRLMRDEELRRRLASAAAESVSAFSMESILTHWDVLFARTVKAAAADKCRGVGVKSVERRA
jgi:GalNAc-alpha-(1->4)-GalNAc-alpha-(1->3)-diNAcBac-PP-undecaprenol alpha-1,4-N-acetyl-D-galactosaminyltransferase